MYSLGLLLYPDPADERLCHDEPTVTIHAQRQRGKPPWRGAAQHLGAGLRIVMREMARAFQELRLGEPVSDLAPGMWADRRVRDDPIGGSVLRLRIEALGVEAQDQNLVEPRPGTHR